MSLRVALRQTAIELLSLYDGTEPTFDTVKDVDALAAWRNIAAGVDTEHDLEIIALRSQEFLGDWKP